MDIRHERLLYTLVREYIRTAEPQSSTSLLKKLRWPVSSATVRNMLRDLEVYEYIEQPHTSAGRIPTDKGYRYYVNSLVVNDLRDEKISSLAYQYEQLQKIYGPSRAAAKLLSELAKAIAISGGVAGKSVDEAGLRMLLNEPEGDSKEAMREVSTLLDVIDDHIKAFNSQEQENELARAYIGEENPAYPATHTSIVARRVHFPGEGDVILMVIGPKRMPYQQHMALLNSFAKIIDQSQM